MNVWPWSCPFNQEGSHIIWITSLTQLPSSRTLLRPMAGPIRNRVELHCHVDGAARIATIWELSKQKFLPLPGDGSLEALKESLVVETPCKTLCDFLSRFKWIAPALIGDMDAIERIAYELCEDKARNGVIYLEMRGCPHSLVPQNGTITVRDVLCSYLKGMQRGQRDFGIMARFIICCLRDFPEKAAEVVDLCDEFRSEGVVGIDIAGDEAKDVDSHGEEHFHIDFISAFQSARRRNIHRTVHAGEAGPANGVFKAMDLLSAERIGHGYRVLEDPIVYEKLKRSGIHLETCPHSSILTGAVPPDFKRHPIARFIDDEVNISISTDDPTITNYTLSDEYNLVMQWGFNTDNIDRTNLNAMRASFLPDDIKMEIISRMFKARL